MQTLISDPQGVEKTGPNVWEILGSSLPATWKTPSLLRCEATSVAIWNPAQRHMDNSWNKKQRKQTTKEAKHLNSSCARYIEILTYSYSSLN